MSFNSEDSIQKKDDRLTSPPQAVSTGSQLIFWHSFFMESTLDGGILEVSIDNGTTFTQVPLSAFLEGGYNGGINSTSSPINGAAAWTGMSSAFPAANRVVVDISRYAGPTTRFRWRMTADTSILITGAGFTGWFVDDAQVTKLAVAGSPPNADADAVTTPANTKVAISVLANDTDPDGGALTVNGASQGAHGATVVNADNTISYTPESGFSGSDSFTYIITDPGGCTSIGTASVNVGGAVGSLQLDSAALSVSEGVGTVTLNVTRTGGSVGAVAVNYATTNGSATDGTDFTAASGTLNFANGEVSKSVTIAINDDSLVEGPETFTFSLSNPTGGATLGAITTSTVTINDNDSAAVGTLQFSSGVYSVNENGATATISVTRTGGTAGAVSVSYATTSGGTATPGSDYTGTSGTLNWPDGDLSSKSFTVSIIDDSAFEGDETINLGLSGATGGASIGLPNVAVLTIVENDTAPAQIIDAITPDTTCQGGGDLNVTVDGHGFVAGSIVQVNGTQRNTSFVNSGRLIVTVNAADRANPGNVTIRVVNPDNTTSNNKTLSVISDSAAPVVTPPAALTVFQSTCTPTEGASGNTSSSLAAFLVAGTGVDVCSASTTRLAPQVAGADASNATVFPAGDTVVTFRFRDNAGNIGTATSTLTVRLYGDLNLDRATDATDAVLIANYLVSNIQPGTPPFTASLTVADVNRDTNVDAVDFVVLLNRLVSNISCLPSN
jgi:hypothetical protein